GGQAPDVERRLAALREGYAEGMCPLLLWRRRIEGGADAVAARHGVEGERFDGVDADAALKLRFRSLAFRQADLEAGKVQPNQLAGCDADDLVRILIPQAIRDNPLDASFGQRQVLATLALHQLR